MKTIIYHELHDDGNGPYLVAVPEREGLIFPKMSVLRYFQTTKQEENSNV